MDMQRITINGVTCAGKSTLAEAISLRLGMPWFDLDELHWGPDWTPVPLEEFRDKVVAFSEEDRWICSGNYSVVRDLIWPRADTLVWLDYHFPLVLFRFFKRTTSRIITGDPVCNGNRETVRGAFFKRDALFWWLLKSYPRRKQEMPRLLSRAEHQHLNIIRLHTPQQAESWLRTLT